MIIFSNKDNNVPFSERLLEIKKNKKKTLQSLN